MEFVSPDSFFSKAKQYNIKLYKYIERQWSNTNFTILDFANLEQFFNFAVEKEAKEIFFCYEKSQHQVFLIDKDVLRSNNISTEEYEVIKHDVEAYNKAEKDRSKEKYYSFSAFLYYEHQPFGIYVINPDAGPQESSLEDEERPHKMLRSIIKKNKELIKIVQKKKAKDLKAVKDSLADQILFDDEFQLCTNKAMRHNYAVSFWNDPENENEMNYFMDFDDFIIFIEQLWSRYKLRK